MVEAAEHDRFLETGRERGVRAATARSDDEQVATMRLPTKPWTDRGVHRLSAPDGKRGLPQFSSQAASREVLAAAARPAQATMRLPSAFQPRR